MVVRVFARLPSCWETSKFGVGEHIHPLYLSLSLSFESMLPVQDHHILSHIWYQHLSLSLSHTHKHNRETEEGDRECGCMCVCMCVVCSDGCIVWVCLAVEETCGLLWCVSMARGRVCTLYTFCFTRFPLNLKSGRHFSNNMSVRTQLWEVC